MFARQSNYKDIRISLHCILVNQWMSAFNRLMSRIFPIKHRIYIFILIPYLDGNNTLSANRIFGWRAPIREPNILYRSSKIGKNIYETYMCSASIHLPCIAADTGVNMYLWACVCLCECERKHVCWYQCTKLCSAFREMKIAPTQPPPAAYIQLRKENNTRNISHAYPCLYIDCNRISLHIHSQYICAHIQKYRTAVWVCTIRALRKPHSCGLY